MHEFHWLGLTLSVNMQNGHVIAVFVKSIRVFWFHYIHHFDVDVLKFLVLQCFIQNGPGVRAQLACFLCEEG